MNIVTAPPPTQGFKHEAGHRLEITATGTPEGFVSSVPARGHPAAGTPPHLLRPGYWVWAGSMGYGFATNPTRGASEIIMVLQDEAAAT